MAQSRQGKQGNLSDLEQSLLLQALKRIDDKLESQDAQTMSAVERVEDQIKECKESSHKELQALRDDHNKIKTIVKVAIGIAFGAGAGAGAGIKDVLSSLL